MPKFSMADLLNAQSKAELPKTPEAPKVKKGKDIQEIPIDLIKPSPKNRFGIRDIEELAAEIETVGLLHNLVVTPTSDGTYELVSGERRLDALKLLVSQGKTQFSTALCKIESSKNPIITELQLLFANSARELTDYEKTYQAQRTKELLLQLKKSGYKFQGRMREIVADMLKVSPGQMGRMEIISKNLSPEFSEEFKAGKINATAAYELSRLPQEQQTAEMAKYRQSGTVEVKSVQAQRRTEKQKPEVEAAEDTPKISTAVNPDQKPSESNQKQAEPDQKQVQRHITDAVEPESVKKRLKAIAEHFSNGSGDAPFDIYRTCWEAIDLITALEGRKCK